MQSKLSNSLLIKPSEEAHPAQVSPHNDLSASVGTQCIIVLRFPCRASSETLDKALHSKGSGAELQMPYSHICLLCPHSYRNTGAVL